MILLAEEVEEEGPGRTRNGVEITGESGFRGEQSWSRAREELVVPTRTSE